jgi:hypothetical protein
MNTMTAYEIDEFNEISPLLSPLISFFSLISLARYEK